MTLERSDTDDFWPKTESVSNMPWWRPLCERFGQDPDDPDAFCTMPHDEFLRYAREEHDRLQGRP